MPRHHDADLHLAAGGPGIATLVTAQMKTRHAGRAARAAQMIGLARPRTSTAQRMRHDYRSNRELT
jgi:hypothetical protein